MAARSLERGGSYENSDLTSIVSNLTNQLIRILLILEIDINIANTGAPNSRYR